MTDDAFVKGSYEDAKIVLSPENYLCENGRMYFLYSVMYLPEEAKYPTYKDSYCLAVLDALYEQWERSCTLFPPLVPETVLRRRLPGSCITGYRFTWGNSGLRHPHRKLYLVFLFQDFTTFFNGFAAGNSVLDDLSDLCAPGVCFRNIRAKIPKYQFGFF